MLYDEFHFERTKTAELELIERLTDCYSFDSFEINENKYGCYDFIVVINGLYYLVELKNRNFASDLYETEIIEKAKIDCLFRLCKLGYSDSVLYISHYTDDVLRVFNLKKIKKELTTERQYLPNKTDYGAKHLKDKEIYYVPYKGYSTQRELCLQKTN